MELNPNIILNQNPVNFGQRFQEGRRARLQEEEHARNIMRQQQQDERLGRQDARLQRVDDDEIAMKGIFRDSLEQGSDGSTKLNEEKLLQGLYQRSPEMAMKLQQQFTERDANAGKLQRDNLTFGLDTQIKQQTIAKGLEPKRPEIAFTNNGIAYDKNDPSAINLGANYSTPKAPQTRVIRMGSDQVTQQFNEATGAYDEIARGSAFAPQTTNGNGQPAWKYDAGSDEFVAPPSEGYPQGQRSGNPAKTAAGNSMGYVISQFRGEPTVGADGKTTYAGGILDKAMQGGMMGATGYLGKVFDSQDQKRFDNLKQQMSTELRTLFRIPGEGALSDSEQKQYGLQLPDVTYDKANNEAILSDVESRIKLRLTPNPGGVKPDTRGNILDKNAKITDAPKKLLVKPKVGFIDEGNIYLGGDASSPKSWKKAK